MSTYSAQFFTTSLLRYHYSDKAKHVKLWCLGFKGGTVCTKMCITEG
jgi:hypothetical protein